MTELNSATTELSSTPAPRDFPFTPVSALEPPAEWAELRQKCPVAPVTLPSGDRAMLLTRYDDIRTALSDPRITRQGMARPDAARLNSSKTGGVFSSPLIRVLNAEGHERWRRMVSKWFTAKRMQALRPEIEATADELVDDMVAHGSPADLVEHLAFPLPVFVICRMLGVPRDHRDEFAHWSQAFNNVSKFTQAEMDSAQEEFTSYLTDLVAAKRADPGDDLISMLITATDAEGRPISAEGMLATGQILLMAGHETTAGTIGKMAAHLLTDRRRWQLLRDDRSLVAPAVEEVLRYDPNGGFGSLRYVHEDVELGGETVPAGTSLLFPTNAGNRDESVFDGADEMDLTRKPNPHITFGAGAHSCLGQQLARAELQAVLEVLLRRLPGLDLAVDPRELKLTEGTITTPLQRLPVIW